MRYPQLHELLCQLNEDNKTLTLEELNEIVNNLLPGSAYNHSQAFFSNSTQNIYSSSWMDAGFLAHYDKNDTSVTFTRNNGELPARHRERREGRPQHQPTYQTLLIKNFSGSFNENGIGHEIINSFDANNNEGNFYIFYVPPYGSVGKETIEFLNNNDYRSFSKILIFDSTTITNILKLKAVVINPIPIESEDEMRMIANQFQYGPNNRPLSQIDFNDEEFQRDRDEDERVELFPFTYKVLKSGYYNLENENLFIWHKRTEQTNARREDSLRKFGIVYGEHASITELNDTTLGEKNYAYSTLGLDLETWYVNNVQPLLNEDHLWRLSTVTEEPQIRFGYNHNNFLEYVKKLYDENLYTNFIYSVLKDSEELKNRFFSFLVDRYLQVNDYNPQHLIIDAQCQSLIEPKKVANKYLKAVHEGKTTRAGKLKTKLINRWHFTEEQIDDLTRFIDGQMDLYLHDDNYRIAIENKINSGINGKHDDIDEDINQLRTYKLFLEDLNTYNLDGREKTNKVILLTPQSVANNFVNYDPDVPVMSYRDLAEFFTANRALINPRYRDDFLNALYKHAVNREEDVTIRFLEALQ